jgi:hypothetical protein
MSVETVSNDALRLGAGSRVAVLGGGPAGSFFAYFLLDAAERVGVPVSIDVYEPRDYTTPGPQGCNMCGGIISESLVQVLASVGINLPDDVVQRGIDSYVLHMDVGSVRIETPLREMRIGASIARGRAEGGDGRASTVLQRLAREGRSCAKPRRGITWPGRRPELTTRGGSTDAYDLLAVAVGVNSTTLAFGALAYQQGRPRHIREYRLRARRSSVPRRFDAYSSASRASSSPRWSKGDCVTVCLLGDSIDDAVIDAFIRARVKACFHKPGGPSRCRKCSPRINVQGRGAVRDRVVFIRDSGVATLWDGIGAAYRTAKAAAETAVFPASRALPSRSTTPVCRAIAHGAASGVAAMARQRSAGRAERDRAWSRRNRRQPMLAT